MKGMLIVDRKLPKRMVNKVASGCCSMDHHLLMRLFRKVSMKDMLTLAECLELVSILPSTAQSPINMCMVSVGELAARLTRTGLVILVTGIFSKCFNILSE